VSDRDIMVGIILIATTLQLSGLGLMAWESRRMVREAQRLTREVEGWLEPGMAELGAKALEEIRRRLPKTV
jgi:hypothetical protein